VNSNEIERDAIQAAIRRLLNGTPIRSSGHLTIIALAQEAGLRRNKLTHKHLDLRDQFRAEVARHDGVSQREIELRDEIAQLTARMVNIKQERDDYRTTSEIFARSMHVLTIENENLRKEITKTRSATIVPMTPRR